MKKFFGLLLLLFLANVSFASTINLVAAENFYGNIASAIGGNHVRVISILQNPNQDPHLFSANPRVAKTIEEGDIIIYNGLGYDSWMNRLVTQVQDKQKVLVVADLLKAHPGDNPHLWYKPEMGLVLAKALVAIFTQEDPVNRAFYKQNFQHYYQRHERYIARIQAIKNHYNNITVIATEPIFNYLADSLGFAMTGNGFQLSVSNGVPPSPKEVSDFETQLAEHKVRFLIYNNQVSNPVTLRMQIHAQENKIPVVGVSEMEPVNVDYLTWMNDNLDAVENALK